MDLNEISEEKKEQISNLAMDNIDHWIEKLKSMSIPSQEWEDVKKNVDGFIYHSCVLPTPNGGPSIGVSQYRDGIHVVVGPRVDDFLFAYALRIKVSRDLYSPYSEKSNEVNNLAKNLFQKEYEMQLLEIVAKLKENDAAWGDITETKELLHRLFKESFSSISLTPFSEKERCDAMFNALKNDKLKFPCKIGDNWFSIHDNGMDSDYLQFGKFAHYADCLSVSLNKGIKEIAKGYSKDFTTAYAKHRAETALKKIEDLLTVTV